MFEIRQPSFSPNRDRSPRRKSTSYLYEYDNRPEIQEVIISIVNVMSIESVDPKLYSYLHQPLTEALNELRISKNRAAINNVSKSLDFIKKLLELQQKPDICQLNPGTIIYSNGAIAKFIEALMKGKELPTLPPKLYNILEQNLKEMLLQENSNVDTNQINLALYTLTKDPKYHIVKPVEEPVVNNDQNAKDRIEQINQKLKSQLLKNETDLHLELDTLKANYDAQPRLVESNKENLYASEPTFSLQEISDLRSKEQYYRSLHNQKKAEAVQKKIMSIIESHKCETRKKIENEINAQRRTIQENYKSKCKIKINHYKCMARKMKQAAQKNIDKVSRVYLVKSAPTLPLLNTRRKA